MAKVPRIPDFEAMISSVTIPHSDEVYETIEHKLEGQGYKRGVTYRTPLTDSKPGKIVDSWKRGEVTAFVEHCGENLSIYFSHSDLNIETIESFLDERDFV
ncbi:hypothetical protein K8R33_02690 [archaeon]|nr:hypothetical protein [archaeon]